MACNSAYDLMVLKKHYAQHQSLFKGTKDEALEDSGPWIFAVDGRLQEIVDKENGVANRYSVLIESGEEMEAVVAHLKQFIYQTIEGREYFFRFWDGRVLAKFLPTCESAQLNEIFEDIDCFAVESGKKGEAIVFTQERGRLREDKLPMAEVLNLSKV